MGHMLTYTYYSRLRVYDEDLKGIEADIRKAEAGKRKAEQREYPG